jgi:hypothetical protein
MRERAGVEVSAVTVVTGHPAVRELAESGEPIVVAPRAPYVPRPQGDRRPSAGSRPPRRTGTASSSGGGPRGGAGRPRAAHSA